MEQPVSERLKILIDAREKGNKAAFGRALGITSQSVADMLELKGGPSFATIQKILKAYPDLSLEWLINGDGQMLKGQQPESNSRDEHAELQIEAGTLLKLAVAEALLAERDKQLASQEKQITAQAKQLETKDSLINRLLTMNGIPEKVGKLLSSSDAALARFLKRFAQTASANEFALS